MFTNIVTPTIPMYAASAYTGIAAVAIFVANISHPHYDYRLMVIFLTTTTSQTRKKILPQAHFNQLK